jgi:hypothetical protein
MDKVRLKQFEPGTNGQFIGMVAGFPVWTTAPSGFSGWSGQSGAQGFSGYSGGSATVSFVQANNTADQATSSTPTDITFNADDFKTGGSITHDPTGVAVATRKFLINSAGDYFIHYQAATNSSDNNATLAGRVRLNDLSTIPGSERQAPCATTGGNSISHTFICSLAVNDFVVLQLSKSTAGENWLANKTNFSIKRLTGVQGPTGQSGFSGQSGVGVPTLVYKSANQTKTNDVTLAFDSELTFTIGSNEKWVFEISLFYSTASAVPDITIALNGPSGLDTLQAFADVRNLSGGIQGSAYLSTYGQTASNDAGAATDSVIIITGTVYNGATSGTFGVQWAQRITSADATVVKKGSYLKAHRI